MLAGCRAALYCIALAGCSTSPKTLPAPPEDATTQEDAASCPFCNVEASAYDVAQPQPPDAIAPPPVACDDAGTCALPPSICADPQWLEYFDNGTCEDGGCAFDVQFHFCDWGCYDGGCGAYHGTTAQ